MTVNDETARMIRLGEKNRELINLGLAWCTHIRTDTTGRGIGLVEDMTGLPITGGRFACDHATDLPAGVGMRLSDSAVSFYERNCVGCEYRQDGGRVPNLSTWAEPKLQARAERQAAAHEQASLEASAAEARANTRRVLGAPLNALAQQIIELVNRIDSESNADEAAEDLRSTTDLSPEAFVEPVQQMLLADISVLRSAVLLEVAVTLEGSGHLLDQERLHEVALVGARQNWGVLPAASYLAGNGREVDLENDLLDVLVPHAAGSSTFVAGFGSRGRPEALLHYHQIAPKRVEQRLAELLVHGDGWRRSASARAVGLLLEGDQDIGLRLLSPLLNSLQHPSDRFGLDSDPANDVVEVLGSILRIFPTQVHGAMSRRWTLGSATYRYRLLSCYRPRYGVGRESYPPELAQLGVELLVAALGEDDTGQLDLGQDYQRNAADLLDDLLPYIDPGAISLEALIAVLLLWMDRASVGSDGESVHVTAELERWGRSVRAQGITMKLVEAAAIAGVADLPAAVSVCQDFFNSELTSDDVRGAVVEVVAELIERSPEAIPLALPLIYRAMLGTPQQVRYAGLRAAREVVTRLPDESLPPLLAEAAVAGLSDQYLIVVDEAVEVVQRLPSDLVSPAEVALRLYLYASSYSDDRLRSRRVQDALRSALRFSAIDGRAAVHRTMVDLALKVVDSMPTHDGRDALAHLSTLQVSDDWASTAIRVMRPDQDSQYESLGDDNKKRVLQLLAAHPRLEDVQLEELGRIEAELTYYDRERSTLVADCLAEHGRFDLSFLAMSRQLGLVPDIPERRGMRRFVELLTARFAVECEISQGDVDAARASISKIKLTLVSLGITDE